MLEIFYFYVCYGFTSSLVLTTILHLNIVSSILKTTCMLFHAAEYRGFGTVLAGATLDPAEPAAANQSQLVLAIPLHRVQSLRHHCSHDCQPC